MKRDPIWQAFARTGDPLYYLLYRAVQDLEQTEADEKEANKQAAAVQG